MTTTENAQRDELALLVSNSGTTSKRSLSRADAILAAGYRKPRTITTMEELDALAEGSVILTNGGEDSAQKDGEGEWYLWGGDYGQDSGDIFLPATVLHEPEAEVGA